MIKCKKCGSRNMDLSKFCQNCGAELPKKPKQKAFSSANKERYAYLLTISKVCIFSSIVALGYFVYKILGYKDPFYTAVYDLNSEKIHLLISFAGFFLIVLTGLIVLGMYIHRMDNRIGYSQIRTSTLIPFVVSFTPVGGLIFPGFIVYQLIKFKSLVGYYEWKGQDPHIAVASGNYKVTEAAKIGSVSKMIVAFLIISMSVQVFVFADYHLGNTLASGFSTYDSTSYVNWDGIGNFDKKYSRHIVMDKTIRGSMIYLRGASELKIVNCILDSCTVYANENTKISITGSSIINSNVSCTGKSMNYFDSLTISNSSFDTRDESQNDIGSIVAETTSFDFRGKSKTNIDTLIAKKAYRSEVLSFRDDCEATIANLQVENNKEAFVLYNQANINIRNIDLKTTGTSAAIRIFGKSKLNIEDGSIDAKGAYKTIAKDKDAMLNLGSVETK